MITTLNVYFSVGLFILLIIVSRLLVHHNYHRFKCMAISWGNFFSFIHDLFSNIYILSFSLFIPNSLTYHIGSFHFVSKQLVLLRQDTYKFRTFTDTGIYHIYSWDIFNDYGALKRSFAIIQVGRVTCF